MSVNPAHIKKQMLSLLLDVGLDHLSSSVEKAKEDRLSSFFSAETYIANIPFPLYFHRTPHLATSCFWLPPKALFLAMYRRPIPYLQF